jgi:hypothetical protein
MNKTDLLKRITKLHKIFHEGKIPTIANHEVHPEHLEKGSRERYLYFTLAPSLNFQRSSPALWTAAFKTWNDPATNYLFFPEQVMRKEREEIQADLVKYKLALQKNKHTDIWITLCRAFNTHFQNDPRALLAAGDWDVVKIHQIIQQERRKDFPYISGPKMANYWLYILSQYTDAQFKNMCEISIIPDTHVCQCSAKLGLTSETMSPIEVAAAWKQLLKDCPLSPVDMHPVLWNWSRNNFLPEV